MTAFQLDGGGLPCTKGSSLLRVLLCKREPYPFGLPALLTVATVRRCIRGFHSWMSVYQDPGCFEIYIRASDCWKLPYEELHKGLLRIHTPESARRPASAFCLLRGLLSSPWLAGFALPLSKFRHPTSVPLAWGGSRFQGGPFTGLPKKKAHCRISACMG